MSTSETQSLIKQKGMTLLEILMVIAIIVMISGLLFSSPQFLQYSQFTKVTARNDFLNWYKLVSYKALYHSQPSRVCLIGQHMVLQKYSQQNGWENSSVMYIPPRKITMSWQNTDCGSILNSGNDDFAAQIEFQQQL